VAGAGCGFIPNPKLKLLEQVSEVMRFEHYPNGAGTAGACERADNPDL
jgi:hypothetical protein